MYFIVDSDKNVKQLVSFLRSHDMKFSWLNLDPRPDLEDSGYMVIDDNSKRNYKTDQDRMIMKYIANKILDDVNYMRESFDCKWSIENGDLITLTPESPPTRKLKLLGVGDIFYTIEMDNHVISIDLKSDEYEIRDFLLKKLS